MLVVKASFIEFHKTTNQARLRRAIREHLSGGQGLEALLRVVVCSLLHGKVLILGQRNVKEIQGASAYGINDVLLGGYTKR